MTSRSVLSRIAGTAVLFIGLAAPKLVAQEESFAPSEEILPLLIDTDMGLDDTRALFALLACPHLDIHGIITVEGSASPGKGTDNLIGLLESNHIETIPVCRGCASSHLEAPHWREAADSLGGAAFPPPRALSPSTDGTAWLDGMLAEHEGMLHYLALGPLTNPARLERKHPGALTRLNTLWIPVKTGPGGEIRAWNLSYDSLSTREVFTRAPDIVLVDLAVFEGIDALEVLRGIRTPSPATAWIERWLSLGGDASSHLMLSDELAAAVFVKPGLMIKGEETFRLEENNGEGFKIIPGRDGNIRIARFRHPRASLEHLQDALGKALRGGHGTEHEPAIPVKELLRTFHGHLGPYVVLGYRMGKLALAAAQSEGHFGISALVYSLLEPPASCLIDGVQLGSGCTLGKRNIEVREIDGPAYAVFTPEGGNRVLVRLRPEIPALVKQLVEEKGVEAAGEDLLGRDGAELFILEITYSREDSKED